MVAIPTQNHGPLRAAMHDAHRGGDVTREELLALAKRHGQTEEIFDADFATLTERQRLHDEYWSSPEGVAITEARQKLAAAADALATAKAEFASTAKVAELEQHRAHAAAAHGKLANANTTQFQAFARAMKATAFPDGDSMVVDNFLVH